MTTNTCNKPIHLPSIQSPYIPPLPSPPKPTSIYKSLSTNCQLATNHKFPNYPSLRIGPPTLPSMASMATFFSKTPSPTLPFAKPSTTTFPKWSVLPSRSFSGASRRRIACSLIEPDGGKLVNLVAPPGAARERWRSEAAACPRISLSRIDLEWVHVLSEGWASPLRGFMREAEFLQTLHFSALRAEDGSVVNMSVPIVLAIDDAQKRAIGEQRRVALVGPEGKVVAILSE